MGTVQKIENDESVESVNKKIDKKQCGATKAELKLDSNNVQSLPSMTSLIIWNISKVLEIVPDIDIKEGIKAAQERLQHDSGNVISQNPQEQHLMCALLAWHKLGHSNTDSLVEFVKAKKAKDLNKTVVNKLKEMKRPMSFIVAADSINTNYSYDSEQIDSVSLETYSKGPVIKLPKETKLIMRLDNTQPDKICCKHSRPKETTKKLDDACCMDTACSEQLAKMDEETEKLRTRAKLLAKREAHRVELLERAEAAWKDLERGYQRRLTLAQEKEEDIAKQIKKIAEERNEYKKACTTLTEELTERGREAETTRVKLKEVETELCNNACKRLKLSEKVAETEAALADHQCKAVQLERDLELKEDQARRKVATYESETESARALTNEAERVLHAELSGLREQITEVSNQLLKEDEENKKLKTELEKLRQEKVAVIADLDGCQLLCDGKIKAQMDDLQNKRQQLLKLKETVLECQCKLPVDAAVMVKRTPSLAALCKCTADDRLLGESCSCTSVRSTVISNLLADLFAGLQSELGGARADMPCKFLKCLEDQHNWDRASEIKSSLRNYFSNLLVEELNVAIATSIENYHARWVGPTCADLHRMIPGPEDDENKGWERRAIERKAQQLATKLAEDLYQQRAAELTKRAKEIVTSGPPPCKCDRTAKLQTETYPCLLESRTVIPNRVPTPPPRQRTKVSPCGTYSPDSWRRTHRDVTQLKIEIEGLKKDAIKKKDLEIMEQKIANIVKRATVPEHEDSTTKYNANIPLRSKKETKYIKTTDDIWKKTIPTKNSIIKKKPIEANYKHKKSQIYEKPTKQAKKFNYHQTYAVNLCLYEQKANKSVHHSQLKLKKSPMNQKFSPEVLSQASSFAQLKPVPNLPSPEVNEMGSKTFAESYCGSNCKCLQKEPSNSSIDKLLEKLSKWKSDLGGPQEKAVSNVSKSFSNKGSKPILETENSKINYSKGKEEICYENHISKKNYQNEKKHQSINNREVVNTESEYIVAVNLDKSVLHVYPDAFKKSEFEFTHPPTGTDIQYPQSCFDKVKLINENSYTKHTTKLHVLTNSKSIGAMPEKRKVKEFAKETNFYTDIKDKKDMVSKNLDYYIKFLGVTLADVNSKKEQKKVVKDHDKGNNYSPPSSYTSKEHNEQYKNVMPQSETSNSTSGHNKKHRKYNSNLSDNNNIANFHNIDDRCNLKNIHTKDVALDSDSLKHSKNTLESCVCCNTKVVDYSKDLEVNTFNLLEVHLREKFKECHICSCNSACFSSEEKEKIFCTTLNRVKQVISDCIKEVKCNEAGNLSTGSWKRAYGLMQEYLKIKVKRAQHLSLSNKEKDRILPEILDTVCNLIDNDFQRIKKICKCRKEDKTTPTVSTLLDHIAVPNKELPVKDINISFKQNETDTIKMVSQQNSPKSSILRVNISSQKDYDLKKETKSFGVMVANDHIENDNIPRKVSTEYCVKSLGLAESKPIAFIPNIPFQVTPDLVIETKACDPMIDAHNIVRVISRPNLVNRIAVSQYTSEVPFNLGRANKTCDANNFNKRVSTANSTLSVVPAQHMSSQVPSNLGKETKSCDTMTKSKNSMVSKANSTNLEVLTNHTSCQVLPIFGVQTKTDNIKTTSSESGPASQSNMLFISEKKSRVVVYNNSSYFYNETESNHEVLPLCNNQRSSVNILRKDGDVIMASKGINMCKNLGLRYVKSLPNLDFEENQTIEENVSTEMYDNLPYIGYTVNCMCDSKLKSCICAKSLIQKYIDRFSNYWQSFYNPNKPIRNCSYILNSNQNNGNNRNNNQKCDNLPLTNVPIFVKQHNADKNACEAEINVRNEEDIVLLLPKQTVETGQRSTNTYVEIANLVTDTESEIPLSWSQCPPQSLSSNTRISAESVYESTNDECMSSYVPSKDGRSVARYSYSFCKLNNESKMSSKSRSIDSDGTGTSENCTCDKVPLCHVKMLVENIEKNLKQCA